MVNKGGRGKKAPYETTHVRVPVPLKNEIDKLIDEWIGLVSAGITEPDRPVENLYKSLGYSERNAYWALNKARQIYRAKTKNKLALIKLVNELFDTQFTNEDLESEVEISKDVNK